ncbi:MAG: ABC transporter permease [Deltaproteobacteria bacterium]|nr:ABC transporter permease [Deltaproteobacteria bacterium]
MREILERFFLFVGGISLLSVQTLRALVRRRPSMTDLIMQLHFIGNRSLVLISVVAIFTGMVMALQLSVGLGRFGLKLYIGQVIGLAIVRELGPVLTCLMVAARIGSGIAAELGSMAVTEQVLAIEAMGANPIQKLVVPRMLACVIAAPLLSALAVLIGVLGGMIVTLMETGVTWRFYYDQVVTTLILEDYIEGIGKTFFFGFFIALIACYQGLQTTGGTEGVGKSTTKAVVYSSLTIFVIDFVLTKLFLLL